LQTPALTSWLHRRGVTLVVERKTGFEPATSSLARRRSTAELLPHGRYSTSSPTPHSRSGECRGGDLNSHGLTPTTPSRWRVYRFHHLGMAGAAGFEPTAGGFGDRCSTRLSYAPKHTTLRHIPLGRLERPTRGLGNRCSIHLSYRGLVEIGGLEPPTSAMRTRRSPS
jgi:hypothetical protein